MSLEQNSPDQVHHRPETWNDDHTLSAETVVPAPEHRDDKDEKKLGWKKPVAAVALLGAVAAGVFGGAKAIGGGEEAPGKQQGQELVLGSDGQPLQYVEYSEEHMDRDNNGTDDLAQDNNRNNINDNEELWDQKNQEFVDPQAGSNETALEQASDNDKTEMEELVSLWPGIAENEPHWAARFVALDQTVQDYILTVARNPQDFESTVMWEAAMLSGFDFTAEELEQYAN